MSPQMIFSPVQVKIILCFPPITTMFSYGICEKAYALNELPIATLEELMDHYYYGDDIYSGDSEIALECALEAERKGSKKCFYKIGLIYQLGTQDRVPDYEMAATYYKKAIENQDYNGMDYVEEKYVCVRVFHKKIKRYLR